MMTNGREPSWYTGRNKWDCIKNYVFMKKINVHYFVERISYL